MQQIPQNARLLYTVTQVDDAVAELATQINQELGDTEVIALVIMLGGLVFAGKILPLCSMPIVLDYIHLSRYNGALTGGRIDWIAYPQQTLEDRTILLIDDIYDNGHTIQCAMDYCYKKKAKAVFTAALLEKQCVREDNQYKPDFVGLSVPDQYVFGCGMDYQQHYRNLNGIYMLPA